MNIIEILTPAYDAAWLPWAVQYFFLVAMATTAAITASFIAFSPAGSEARRLLPAAVTVCSILAFLCSLHPLVMDVHWCSTATHLCYASLSFLPIVVVT